MDNVPELVKNVEDSEAKIDWGKLSEDVLKYSFNSEDLLSKVYLPMNAICCTVCMSIVWTLLMVVCVLCIMT